MKLFRKNPGLFPILGLCLFSCPIFIWVEFPTSFSYGFCLCFVKIPCLAPIGLYHKNLTITYRPSFSLPSKHFSTYVLDGFGRFFNDPLKNQSWNRQNEQNRRPLKIFHFRYPIRIFKINS